jgi:hypothetical protein
MPTENRILKPGRKTNTLVTANGEELVPPAEWQLLPPGDGPLTRLVKAKGPTWQVQVKVGRRIMSRGVWANGASIAAAVEELKGKRTAPGYDLRRAREQTAKARKHQEYVAEFHGEVVKFLDFHPRFAGLAEKLANRVTDLATPVGSGTVARTERIPVADRAGAAVIAWMRHQVTNYDRMTIARVKGRRREVRRELAAQSVLLLTPYRRGDDPPAVCPLGQALRSCRPDSPPDRLENED